jgi:hypothetical protein
MASRQLAGLAAAESAAKTKEAGQEQHRIDDSPVKNGIRDGAYVIGNAANMIEEVEYEHLLAGRLAHVDGHEALFVSASATVFVFSYRGGGVFPVVESVSRSGWVLPGSLAGPLATTSEPAAALWPERDLVF